MKRVVMWGMLAVALAGWPGLAVSQQKNPADIIRQVRATLEKLKTLQGTYEQIYYRSADERNMVTKGTLWLREPSQFRLEDSAKAIVTDGKSVWMYVPANKQVQVSAFSGAEEDYPTPMSLFERYAADRKPSSAGAETLDGRTFDIILLPAPEKGGSEVRVWVDRERSFPYMTLETLPNGDTVRYTISGLTMNSPLADSLFAFEPPAGVEVIDLRE